MNKAAFKQLEDCSYFGEIPDLEEVWSHDSTLEACDRGLQTVLEEWIVLQLHLHAPVPTIDGIDIDPFQPNAVDEQDDLEELQAIYDAANTEGTVSLDCLETRRDAMVTQLQ